MTQTHRRITQNCAKTFAFNAIAILIFLLSSTSDANLREEAYYKAKFDKWVSAHDFSDVLLVDDNSREGDLYKRCLKNFADNDDIIETHNAYPGISYRLGHNMYSHMSSSGFHRFMNLGGMGTPLPATKLKPAKPVTIHRAPSRLSSSTKGDKEEGEGKEKKEKEEKGGNSPRPQPIEVAIQPFPSSIDWVGLGAVSPVQNQGACGSCWAFAVAGALEGAYFKAHNNHLEKISIQHFIDCDNYFHNGKNFGCYGGRMSNAFEFAKRSKGICLSEEYPLDAFNKSTAFFPSPKLRVAPLNKSACRVDLLERKKSSFAPVSFTAVEEASEEAFMSALAEQPLSVGVQAMGITFQLYSSGVYTGHSPTVYNDQFHCNTSSIADLDHAMLAVGYGSLAAATTTYTATTTGSEGIFVGIEGAVEADPAVVATHHLEHRYHHQQQQQQDYYILKNSWGRSWGENGYMRLARGKHLNSARGLCGVLLDASYPNIKPPSSPNK